MGLKKTRDTYFTMGLQVQRSQHMISVHFSALDFCTCAEIMYRGVLRSLRMIKTKEVSLAACLKI